MKRKLLFAVAALFGMTMSAQTDVTSTYLTNAGFELKAEGTAATAEALTNNGSYYGWQLPNLGTQYVNISIGDATTCNGQAFGVPAAKEGSTYYYCRRGWNNNSSADATLSTTATLPVGSYKLTVSYKGLDSYDGSHNFKGSNLIVNAVEGGSTLASVKSASFEAVNGNTAGANKFTGDANWKELSLSFEVAEAGEVSLNFVHHLVGGVRTDVVIDDVKLYSIPALDKAKDDAKAALPAAAPALFGLTADQIASYASQIDAATTEAAINTILDEVNNYVAPAFSGSWNILNSTASMYMGTNDASVVLSELPVAVTFEKADNGVYIKAGENYINMAGNNPWSMSAGAEAKTAWTFALSDGKYTIAGPNGLIGSDNTAAGSILYGNKGVANNGYWTISVAVSDDELELIAAKNALQSAIDSKTVPTANIEGKSENLFVWTAASVEDLKEALAAAQDVLDNSTDLSDIKAQTEALEAVELEVKSPFSDTFSPSYTPYNIIMAKEGLGWTGKAVTFTYNSNTQNGYGMAYTDVAGTTNYNQAVYFASMGKNQYIMFIGDANYDLWYLTNGTKVGSTVTWAADQLRMTDNMDDAMVISIMPSMDVEDVVEMINTWTGIHIGSTNNNGFYCSNDNYELSIKPAASMTVTVNTSNKYATAIIPCDAEIPTNTKIYTVAGVDENGVLTLEEETEYVHINVPYIVESEESECEFEVLIANGFKPAYTEGLLTGVYTDTAAPKDAYVLQSQEGVVGFYQVGETVPTVKANRAYLTAPAATEAKAFTFGQATAIKTVEALTSGKAEIFDMNGRQINKLQKGINIVNGVKILVK